MFDHNRASIKPVVLQILELVRTGQLSSRAAAPLIRALSESQDDRGAAASQPVAIVGLGGSFPGSSNIPLFWKALHNGADAVTEIPSERWDWQSVFSEQVQAGKTYSRWGGFLQGVQQFDPLFFNISPREALAMDPQQRIFLQAAWHALEDGGYADLGSARQRCGVFTGCRDGDYRNLLGDAKLDSYAAIGCDTAILSARIAYLLDLAGPAITIDSACSSSLSAVALACTSLQAGLCDLALAGGVSVLCTPELHISLGQTGMLSRSGRCRAFDADADGFVPAEGVGVALLKPLSAALADGDHIYAVIEAWGMNQDGRTNGITAPSGAAQADLLTETYRKFGISPQTIGYVETHGTGTQLGDPIELEGLHTAFRRFTNKSHFCAIGSVKSNIGHSLAASGIAGLIKAVGSLRFQEIYPSNHYRKGNPHFDLSDSPFWVNTELRHWESMPDGTPRRAAVSSFGFSGTNAHVVLREAPLPAQSSLEGSWLFPFSGRTSTALEAQLRQTNAWLEQEKPNLANLSYTLIKGRSMFEERVAVTAASHYELASKINLCLLKQSAATLPADAQLWLNGDRTACVSRASELRRQGAAHINAPLYPFEKQSFWPVESNGGISNSDFRIDGHEPFLTDHLIHGLPTVPGVVLLCLAGRNLPVGYQLRDFTWTHPLVWSGQTVDLAVRWRHVSQTYEFTIESKEGIHASGRANRPLTSASPDRVNLEALKSRLGPPLMASDVYARFSKLGFNYGPSLQGVAELMTGSTEALALLRSPIGNEKASLQFPFSIGILDGGIQTLLGLQISGAAWAPVPFSVREFLVYRAIGDQCYAWLRLTGQGTDWLRFDIDFLDQTGNVLAQLNEFTVRPLAGQQVAFPAVSKNSVQTLLIRILAREVGLEESRISVRENFSRYGIDSMMVLNMTRELESTFGELPKTLFFEFNSIATLADHLSAQFPNAIVNAAELPPSAPLSVKAKPHEEPIAIVGISGRFPEAANLDEFWKNLRAGRDCIREVPLDRWDHSRYFTADRGQVGKTWSRWGGFLNQVEYFDPLLFRISPREAEVMDPQERLFLETVWETIENAGYTPADFSNQIVGVYAGAMYTQYQLYGAEAGVLGTPLALTSSQAAIANRVSYFFDFQGPSIGLDTMCSSSLTAIHLACDALRRGEIEAAIAGGVNLTVHPQKYLLLSQANVASSDGRCRSFGAGGDGYVPGEGVGAVLLKPLSRALSDGDTVYGLVRGSAINHGGRTNGFTVPSVTAQAAVISRCLEQAKVEPSRISYVEAHGTGTALGDPIELAALDRAFAKSENHRAQCVIGSVKSNIGHLESAAGMASLAKVLLQMRYRELVPSIHAATLNPNLAFERSHFTLQRTLTPWLSPQEETRLAGISSFGAGGANAHLIVEEFLAHPLPEITEAQILPLSARTPELLRELCRRMAAFADHMAAEDGPNRPRLADVAYTLQVGRTVNEYRMAVVASSFANWSDAIRHWLEQESLPPVLPAWSHLFNLGQRWVGGEQIDWSCIRPDSLFKRVPLPTSPFLRERCWADSVPVRPIAEASPITQINQSWLDDHRIQGRQLLPATALIELLRSESSSDNIRCWTDLRWLQPVWADEQPLELELKKIDQSSEAEVALFRAGVPVATAHPQKFHHDQPQRIDIQVIRDRLTRIRSHAMHYDECEKAGLYYGASFRVVEEIRTGSGEAFGKLRWQGITGTPLPLDPALLDGGLQTVAAIEGCWTPGEAPLPSSIGEITFYQPLPATVLVYARVAEDDSSAFHVDFCSSDGEVCVQFRHLRVQQPRRARETTHLYTRRWQPIESPMLRSMPERIIVFAPPETHELSLPGVSEVAVVQHGSVFQKTGKHSYSVPPSDLTAIKKLVAEWRQNAWTAAPIVFAWPQSNVATTNDIESFFLLTRALLEEKPAKRREIYFFHPAGMKGPEPRHAAVAGFARTLNQENPNLQCRVVEYPNDSFVSTVLQELGLSATNEIEVAHRNGQRLLRTNVPLNDVPLRPLPLERKGIYLITGGHGGIGFAIAEFLAKGYAARLVLVSRSCPSTATVERITSLRRYGAEILSLQTDVSDLLQVENAIRQAVVRFGGIDGVIHSAGVLRDGFLLTKSWSDFQTVLAPKVAGTENLLHALSGEKLKFVALFSSLAGVLGNSGQADYSYANAFLDNFAALWKGSVPIVSINWPYWREGGMRLSERAQLQMIERSGLLPLEREQGLAAFQIALTAGEPNVLVAAGDRDRIDKLLASSSNPSPVIAPTAQPHVMASVLKAVGQVLKLAPDRIKTDQPLSDYGMDSVAALQIASSLKSEFGPQPETLLFEHTTIEAVARYLVGSVNQTVDTAVSALSPDKSNSEDIAIIGLAGRYAFAESLSELWTNLSTGRDCVIEIPSERWSTDSWFGTGKSEIGKSASKWGSFLSDFDRFDPRFFGITPREAELIDPQERIFLEVAWHALEDAALTRQSLANCSVGVFAGAMWSHYQLLGETALEQGRPLPASSFSSIANRLSYFGGFRGPSLTVDTMCSSSLTAIHLAAESLRRHECDTAIAGAVNLSLHPHKYVLLSQGNFVSPTGRCRSFGENADGYVPGEGAGAVVLKRLAEAVRDGDPIRAVIKATAINHGGRGTGYSVPNAQAQAALLRNAWERTGDKTALTYIEAHGTGTSLGDPLEIAGLRQALQELSSVGSCRIGSIKSNLGHLEAAAGIAGLTKTVLQLEHRQLTPSLHAEPASSKLNFGGLPIQIQTQLEDWRVPAGSKRRAGVSSFGAGGSNAHVVVDEYVSSPQVQRSDGPEIVVLSARTVESLRKIAEALANFVEEHQPALHDLCWTLQIGREVWEERAAFIANDLSSVVTSLRELAMTGSLQNGFRARAQKQGPTAATNLSLEKRAELWTLGSTINWKEHQRVPARRISLPGYQFARERYWIITNQLKATPPVATLPSRLAHLGLLLGKVAQLQPDEIDPDTNFADLGLDSILQREFITALEQETGPLPSTLLWEYSTLSAIATYLGTLEVGTQVAAPQQTGPPSSALPIVTTESEDIAIIGLHGRYPGAENLDEFWNLLQEGRSSIKAVPPTRWSAQTEKDVYCQTGAFLDGVDQFDPLFFGITPVEAAQITPEERLLLESAWACLENAGYARQNCRGHTIGVFVGATTNTYPLVAAEAQNSDGVMAPDTATYSFANRISYVMDWQGPSLTIDTACSSALVAIQLACDSLKRGESEAALASSVNLYLHPAKYKRMCQGKLLAREASSGLFAADAEGFIPGEGVGSVLLKPLSAALRDQDPIHGVIRGIKVRHKGRSNGFLAPSAAAEQTIVSETLSSAGLDSSAVQYLELQATGAAGTDTLEVDALRSIFPNATFGSLKPNIGHLEAASGMAALTKVLLQLKHGYFAPVKVAEKRHQELQLRDSDFHLPEKIETWIPNDGKRRAGLGSFGAGGLNAYLIVEEFSPRKVLQLDGEHAIVLSAPSRAQLHNVEQRLSEYLDRHSDISLPALTWTLQSGREEFSERAAIVVSTIDELRAALREGRLTHSRAGKVVAPAETSAFCDLRNAVSLWLKGARLDWRRFYSEEVPVRLSLPHYPFERIRCWIDTPAKDQVTDYYDITADAVADEPLMLTFAPFPERIPGFQWLSAMADGAANPEWRDLVVQRQREMRQVAFGCIDWTKVKRILDIGCGLGTDLVRLLNEHPKVTGDGFTISAAQAIAARKLVHQNKLADRCDIHHADSATASFPGSYNLIFGFEVTFHIREKQALFANLARYLTPDGKIILIDCVATTATPLHAPHLGQFTSNESEWAQVLSAQGLCLKRVIDVSPQITNFLYDPDFESHLQALSARADAFRRTEAEHRGWHRFGQALEDGLIRYTILEITRGTGQDSAELATENLRQLQHPASYSELRQEDNAALERIAGIAAAVLQIPKERLDPDQPFGDYGVNSLVGLRLLDRINKNLGLRLEMSILYSAPTLRALSAHVPGSLPSATTSAAIALPSALPEFEPIAVIGMAGRFPGARNVGEFWRNLAAGYDAVNEVPGERWDWREYFDPVPSSVGRTYSRWGGFLDGATEFDPAFFRIAPADAEVMDPQQRLFLQVCWQALEDAGYTGERVQGARCGVMAGVLESDFGHRLDVCANPTRVAQGMLGNAPSILAARIAYFLNLKGLAVSINTACSSSLVGIHLACQSLRSRETDLMLAGGTSLYLNEQPFIMMSKAGMLSPTGKCRAFDAKADGIVVGEAAAAVVLKRLSDAQRDGDIIYGVIESTGTSQDGTTNGITAPNGDAQRELEQSVLRQTGRSASSISYIECHGTGTRLGDPIEVQAIQQAYQGAHQARERCALGAVKSNIGHTSAAAGVAGLIKVLLALRHKQIPPSLHVESINPLLQLDQSAFYINRALQPWEPNGEVRVAGINSFGYSGTNAHILLTEPPSLPVRYADEKGPFLIPLSARDEEDLRRLAQELAEHLGSQTVSQADTQPVKKILSDVLALPVSEIRDDTPVADLGWDAHYLALAARQFTQHLGVPISAGDLLASGTIATLSSKLRAPMEAQGDIAAIAATFQCDREAFAVRAACIAGTAQEFHGQLKALADRQTAPGLIVRSTITEAKNIDPDKFFRTGNWQELAQIWVSGSAVNWRELYRRNRDGLPEHRERLLPPYPFKRQLFPLPVHHASSQLVQPQALNTEWHCDGSLLQAHQIGNEAILPGVISLAATVAGARKLFPDRPIAGLSQFVWLAPVQEKSFNIQFETKAETETIAKLVSVGNKLCAQGHVVWGAQATLPEDRYPVMDWWQAGTTPVLQEEFYKRFAGQGICYGNSLRVVQELRTVGQGFLSRIALPGDSTQTPERFLEGAFQTVIGSFDAGRTGISMPFSVEECQWSESLPSQGYAWVTSHSDTSFPTFDLLLLDENGRLAGYLNGLTLREKSQSLPGPTCYAETVWEPRPLSVFSEAASEHWSLTGFSDADYNTLQTVGHFTQFTLGHEGQTDRVIARLPGNHAGTPAKEEASFYDLLDIAKRLTAQSTGKPIKLLVVVPQTSLHPSTSPLHAVARSLRLETTNLECRVLELDFLIPDWTDKLMGEAHYGASEDFAVRYRGKERQVLLLHESLAPPKHDPKPHSQPRTWIITGATGGLGKLAARYLAETGAANLVLTGRSQPDEDLTRTMNTLRGLGAKVIYCPADLTMEPDVGRLVAEARKQFGAVEGWLHAAGVSRAARLPFKTNSDIAAVMGPKVTGTLLLDKELRKEPIKRIILFSSIAGVLGDFGQTDYAFANAFMDAFAEQHKSHAVSIRWPLCSSGRMQTNEANQEYLRRNFGMQPLPDGVFRQVLGHALTSDTFHLLPLYGEIQQLRHLFNISTQVPDRKEVESMQTEHTVETALVEAVRDITQLAASQIDLASDLREYGLDSIGYTELANKLNARFGVSITPTLFFESANLQAVADVVRKKLSQRTEGILKPAARVPTPAATKLLQRPSVTLPEIVEDNGVAIIGMAGRFPGAETSEEFWSQLAAGADLITEMPPERRALAENKRADSEAVSRWGGFIADVDGFDASLFGISPREAALMDPQQRLFLETAWATIEDAGYRPSSLAGTATGVFVGVANMDYANLMAREGTPVETHATTGVSHAILANRVSYLLDLRGPSEPIDTACSSSLIAVHRAMEAIHSGSCDQAIAGGVNVLLSEELFISFSKAGMLSSSGRCRTFDASADGYVRGEGVGAVFLKPLSKAIADGDQILAVIRASGESHNGRANGLTAPNGEGQKSLLVRTYTKSGIDPTTVTYVEAHGTATQLGDPVECNALRNAFEHLAQERQGELTTTAFCGLGSVKSNIGHLETAAGIAGLQKVILALRHKYLPPTLHVQQTNPYLQLADSPLYLVTKGREWHTREGQLRRAGISSFGFGGANAHLIVEEAQELLDEREFSGYYVFVLSGRTAEQLQTAAERLLTHIKADFSADHLARLAFTLQTGRDAYAHRLAIVAQSRDELVASLHAFRTGQTNTETIISGVADETSSATLLLLSGPEGRDFIQALLRNQKPIQLARLWVAGASLDWNLLYTGGLPRRISAPTHPFLHKRYWFTDLRQEADQPVTRISRQAQEPDPDAAVVSKPALKRVQLKSVSEPIEVPSVLPIPKSLSPLREERELLSKAMPARLGNCEEISAVIREQLARVLFLSKADIADERPFVELGLDSILAVELVRFLNRHYSIELKASRLFDYPTIATLAGYVSELSAVPHKPVAEPQTTPVHKAIHSRLTMHLSEIRR